MGKIIYGKKAKDKVFKKHRIIIDVDLKNHRSSFMICRELLNELPKSAVRAITQKLGDSLYKGEEHD